MEDLIEDLHISPFAGNWLSETIVSFLQENNLKINVNGSPIKEREMK